MLSGAWPNSRVPHLPDPLVTRHVSVGQRPFTQPTHAHTTSGPSTSLMSPLICTRIPTIAHWAFFPCRICPSLSTSTHMHRKFLSTLPQSTLTTLPPFPAQTPSPTCFLMIQTRLFRLTHQTTPPTLEPHSLQGDGCFLFWCFISTPVELHTCRHPSYLLSQGYIRWYKQ